MANRRRDIRSTNTMNMLASFATGQPSWRCGFAKHPYPCTRRANEEECRTLMGKDLAIESYSGPIWRDLSRAVPDCGQAAAIVRSLIRLLGCKLRHCGFWRHTCTLCRLVGFSEKGTCWDSSRNCELRASALTAALLGCGNDDGRPPLNRHKDDDKQ